MANWVNFWQTRANIWQTVWHVRQTWYRLRSAGRRGSAPKASHFPVEIRTVLHLPPENWGPGFSDQKRLSMSAPGHLKAGAWIDHWNSFILKTYMIENASFCHLSKFDAMRPYMGPVFIGLGSFSRWYPLPGFRRGRWHVIADIRNKTIFLEH